MESLFGLFPFALIALVCPLAMLLMMRGMHGGHREEQGHSASNTEADQTTATRLAAMEQEITRLRGELDASQSLREQKSLREGRS